jgi:chromosome segregation ATPase
MDINQIAQMIEWLDEERRRDKATIATLTERLEQQAETINTLQRRVINVESDQTTLQEGGLTASKDRDVIESLRSELQQMVETSEARRLTAEREAERRQELARDNAQRYLREIEERVDKLQRTVNGLGDVRMETSRATDLVEDLQQTITDMTKKFEEPDRRLAFLEEQQRQNARRLSEAESETPELRKMIERIVPKLTLIEDLAIRNERRIQESQNADRERREQMQQFIDSQSLMVQQSSQQIEDIQRRYNEHQKEMQSYIDRFETWAQAYREMKRIIDDFERIGDRLERRISEVAEMQRLSEERFRQEWNDWRTEDQKRWKNLTLSSDEIWRNHDREFEGFIRRIDALEEELPSMLDSLKRLWGLQREQAQLYRERYQALLLEYDTDPRKATSTFNAEYDSNPQNTNGNQRNGGNGNHNGTNGNGNTY